MKFFVLILASIVLALSILPCNDIHGDRGTQKTEITSNSTENHQDDFDYCSPFCSCNCCQHLLYNQVNYINFTCFNYSVKNYILINYHISFNTPNSIWQPPKMS